MQKSSAPLQFVLPFAANAGAGYRHTVPVPSQTGTDPALASYNDGFPPATMEQSGAGGLPPYGQDMNGVLYAATLALQWQQAGFVYPYSSAFATASTVSGYPAGALLLGANGYNLWLNGGDNNQTNPDTSAGAGWTPVFANAGATNVNTTGGTVTLTQNQLTSLFINITGALTSNLTLVLPLTNGARYLVKNSTTGAFTVTIQGATGSGVSISSSVPQHVFSDGTNWYGAGLTGGPYLPLSGTAVAATQLATPRTITATGDIGWTVTFDGSANVTAAGTIAAGAVTLAKMANFQANSLMGNPTSSAAAPSAITLQNGLTFSGTNLGLGNITPTSVAATANSSFAAALMVNQTGTHIAPLDVQTGVGRVFLGVISSNNAIVSINSGNTAYTPLNFQASTYNFTSTGLTTFSGAVTASSLTSSNNVTANTNFVSSNNYWLAATTGAGTIFMRPNGVSSSSGQFELDSTGAVTINGTLLVASAITGSGYNTSSDETLKAGINRSATPRDLSSVPYATWTHLRGAPVQGRGAIAQDMQKIAPEHVREAADGTLGIDYSMASYEQSMFNRRLIAELEARMARAGV